MNANLTSCISDLYATVDLSKKRKKKTSDVKRESYQDSRSNIPLYAVVDEVHGLSKQNREEDVNKGTSTHISDDQEQIRNDEEKKEHVNIIHNSVEQSFKISLLAKKLFFASFITFLLASVIVIITLFVILFIKVKRLEFMHMEKTLLNQNNTIKEGCPLCDQTKLNISLLMGSVDFQRQLGDEVSNYVDSRFEEVHLALSNISTLLKTQTKKNESLLNTNITSCADLYKFNSSSSSGYYTFRSSIGQLVNVYCDMTRTCSSITGGWMRVAELDVYSCPSGLRSDLVNGTRTCIQTEKSSGCTPSFHSSFNISFSKVCGHIVGYGIGTLDGFRNIQESSRNVPLSDNYLDGISVSVNGTHVWSLVTGHCDDLSAKPDFVGNDYTCTNSHCTGQVCPDLLWNTMTGGIQTPFFKDLLVSTTADVVMKVCRDEERSNEDIAIVSAELYVQ